MCVCACVCGARVCVCVCVCKTRRIPSIALSDSKYHRHKRFVLYMHSIQDGSQQDSITVYSEFASYNIIQE